MRQKLWNMCKAFITGFIVVSVVLLALNLLAPVMGLDYVVGWGETFTLDKGIAPVVHVSWLIPIIIGLLFALVQMTEDFETSLAYMHKKLFKKKSHKRLFSIVWHGVWGFALGFVISMFLLALLVGAHGTYSIPFVLEVSAAGSSVTGTTTIISLFTFVGLGYGVWKTSK